jgi:hypothetical protein
MPNNYLIVLFKNKKKRKIIKRYATEKNAKQKFNELIKENAKIYFDKKIENATDVDYELAILTNKSKIQSSLFLTDELGRNVPVNLDNPEFVFLDIKKYKIEELLFDWQKQKKISFDELLKTYLNEKELKSIYTLNNKLCIQIDTSVSIFSLKDSDESDRFLDILQNYFMENNRNDGLFVSDISSAQRKWLYSVLEEKGFDKKRLYRLKTTFSKR